MSSCDKVVRAFYVMESNLIYCVTMFSGYLNAAMVSDCSLIGYSRAFVPLLVLKLNFSQYPSIHTNYIISNCTTL